MDGDESRGSFKAKLKQNSKGDMKTLGLSAAEGIARERERS